jgi:hypothetical protein
VLCFDLQPGGRRFDPCTLHRLAICRSVCGVSFLLETRSRTSAGATLPSSRRSEHSSLRSRGDPAAPRWRKLSWLKLDELTRLVDNGQRSPGISAKAGQLWLRVSRVREMPCRERSERDRWLQTGERAHFPLFICHSLRDGLRVAMLRTSTAELEGAERREADHSGREWC